jgi:retinol-binding protein 3
MATRALADPASCDDPAGELGRRLAAVLRDESPGGVDALVSEGFAPEFRDAFPLQAHRDAFAGMWKDHPRPELRQAQVLGERVARLWLQSTLNESWLVIDLGWTPTCPERIDSLRFSPADGAPDPALAGMGQGAVTPEQRLALLRAMGELLRKHYVSPETGASVGQKLLEAEQRGDYAALSSVTQLAARLTADLRRLAGDKHLGVREVSAGRRSPPRAGSPPGVDNHGYAESKLLEGNVGYVDLRFFAPAEVAEEAAGRAMQAVATADALVFDLRNNGGGAPSGVQYLCSYLFTDKVHLNSLYWREGDRTEEFWTLDEVRGKKRPDVPVFVLTSERTFSGAEEFAYDLQTRKRATIVGEVTGGGANPGGSFALGPGLSMGVPTGRAINPVTQTNWEGVGVQPDVLVDEEHALERALELARAASDSRRRSP